MKKVLRTIAIALTALIAICSCENYETYADQKAREKSSIQNLIAKGDYITKQPIKVISEQEFKAKGCTTDVTSNEYVLFEATGIYMQIIDKGCGNKLEQGENTVVLCRFSEYNINTDSLQLSNKQMVSTALTPDCMTVRNNSGTISASFTSGIMYSRYQSKQVPDGWLAPLTYINLGRPTNESESDAHVRIIVPHNQGHASASSSVYACFYDITYRRGND